MVDTLCMLRSVDHVYIKVMRRCSKPGQNAPRCMWQKKSNRNKKQRGRKKEDKDEDKDDNEEAILV